MKRRHIIIAAIVLAILAPTIWRGCSSTPKRLMSPVSSMESTHPPEGIDSKHIQESTAREEREAVIKEKSIAFAKANNAPIAFYGRVVDQDNKPLQGVTVNFYVTAIPMIPVPWGSDETNKDSCETDQSGRFSVEGKRGVSFGVASFRKAGYRESGYYKQGHARYEPYGSQSQIPDRDKPVDFILIRDDLPKAKEVFDQRLRLNWNAGTTTKDFGPDIGKIEFTASRTGRDATNTLKKFEWEVKMRAIGFTMTKLKDENERIAPLAGYSSNGRVGFSPDEKTWKLRPEENYAILTNDGAYGLINLSVYGDGEDGGMSGRITIYLNKSGSRNIDH